MLIFRLFVVAAFLCFSIPVGSAHELDQYSPPRESSDTLSPEISHDGSSSADTCFDTCDSDK